jgi:hypothetical protein
MAKLESCFSTAAPWQEGQATLAPQRATSFSKA